MRTNIFPSYDNKPMVYKNNIKKLKHKSFFNYANQDNKLIFANTQELPEIIIVSTYPPVECGIATYSQDLRNAIQEKFGRSFSVNICALETEDVNRNYTDEVKYHVNSNDENEFYKLANKINANKNCVMIFLQHEFGLFGGNYGSYIILFLKNLEIPISITFHTVLPNPLPELKKIIQKIVFYSTEIVVMTHNSKALLKNDYGISTKKISVIPHGTHLVAPLPKAELKARPHFADRIVLSTFGLLNEGKNIETALEALPKIISIFPSILYLIIGKTHPEVVKKEGEQYRESLYKKVNELKLHNNVRFINKYLSMPDLIKYLQRTDIYLFTAKDPNQAVSGTLAYAMSCGCPVISTPIPHAKELLDGVGIIFEFQNSNQLANQTINLLSNPKLLQEMRLNTLYKISPTAWQNAAIAHIDLLKNSIEEKKLTLQYTIPPISLDHINRLTTFDGMIQFSNIATPNLETGYTLDDNARALIAMVKHYEIFYDFSDLTLIENYVSFILFCQEEEGNFLNYVDKNGDFTVNNKLENLEDANGRAIWALGEFVSRKEIFPTFFVDKANVAIQKSLKNILEFQSPRAISFAIKGLYFYDLNNNTKSINQIITKLADNLVSKYRGVSDENWSWFENYLTYANSCLPEALLYASLKTKSKLFKNIAKETFDFLLTVIFKDNQIKVVSNQGWKHKNMESNNFGEQPIDVAYTILALQKFHEIFHDQDYYDKMVIAFNWFLGKNHLNQIMYNSKTGGCYDGLEEDHVNLNQGAESTISYLLARLVFEKIENEKVEVQLYEEQFQYE